MNDSIQSIGYRKDDLIGVHFSQFIHPEDVSNFSREYVLPLYQGKDTGDQESPKLIDERRGEGRGTEDLPIRLHGKKSVENKKAFNYHSVLYSYGVRNSFGQWANTKELNDEIHTVCILK